MTQKGYVFDPKQQQLRGVSFASSSDVTANDSILTAIGKLQAKATLAGTGPFVRTAGDTPLTANWNVGTFGFTNVASIGMVGNINFSGATRTIQTSDANSLQFGTNGVARITLNASGKQTHTSAAQSSGSQAHFTWTQPNNTGGDAPFMLFTAGTLTGQTASTEIIDQHWNNSATLTRAAGTVALQRGSIITGRTYAFASSSIITLASAFDVVQSIAGSNATISANYAQRWVNDANNYVGINISSIGLVTYTAVGTSNPGFVWNQFAVFNGSLTTATTTGNASVYFAAQNSTTNNTSQAELNIGDTGTMYARWWNRGSVNYTPAANGNYGSYVMGKQAVTIAGSGTHSLFAQAIFRPLSITTGGGGALTNSATVFIEAAATGATNNYSLLIAAGTFRTNATLELGTGAQLSVFNGVNFAFGSAGAGTKLGTATSQLIGFWNATPVVQPSSTGQTAGFTAGAGTNVTDQSTFTGGLGSTAYTPGDIVRHLKTVGMIAL